ncbi:MAG: penicillin-binding protein activator LpoB, partial [Bacteroidota bacterium]
MVSEEMISDALSNNWLTNHSTTKDQPPVVIVGTVRNESMEHIDTDIITKEMERAFVNSGLVTLVANALERSEIREERNDQQSNASLESMKEMAKELGADYMLIGNISSILDDAPDGRTTAIFYTVNLE